MRFKDTHIIFKPYFLLFILFVLLLMIFSLVTNEHLLKKPVYYDKNGLPLSDFVIEGQASYFKYEPVYYFGLKMFILSFSALFSGLITIGQDIYEVIE
jgi:hypothetical protein